LDSDIAIEALEKSVTKAEGGIQRFIDILAETGRYETKNYSNYTKLAREDIANSLRKDLINLITEHGQNPIKLKEELGRTHFMLRGSPDISPSLAKKMIEEMETAGREVLELIDEDEFKGVFELFDKQIAEAYDIVKNGTIQKTLPADGQLIIFQGKTGPYGLSPS
jgi:hypothetical protein